MNHARRACAAVIIGGLIQVMGEFGSKLLFKSAECFKVTNKIWRDLASKKEARGHPLLLCVQSSDGHWYHWGRSTYWILYAIEMKKTFCVRSKTRIFLEKSSALTRPFILNDIFKLYFELFYIFFD